MKKIQLARYGGLSPVKQKHYTTDYDNMSYHGAPEKYGFYSFLFPYIDWFLLGGNTGKLKNQENKTFKRKRDVLAVPYKKFSVDGWIWTHIEPKGKIAWMAIENRGSWYKVHSSNFLEVFKQHFNENKKYCWQINEQYGGSTKPSFVVKNPFTFFCTDHLEIFVPKGTKIKNF